MIKSINHKGLAAFFYSGTTRGINVNHVKRLRMQLSALDTANTIKDLNISGYRLHQLRGQRKGVWSITVTGNWRLTFVFENGHVFLLNYEDYH